MKVKATTEGSRAGGAQELVVETLSSQEDGGSFRQSFEDNPFREDGKWMWRCFEGRGRGAIVRVEWSNQDQEPLLPSLYAEDNGGSGAGVSGGGGGAGSSSGPPARGLVARMSARVSGAGNKLVRTLSNGGRSATAASAAPGGVPHDGAPEEYMIVVYDKSRDNLGPGVSQALLQLKQREEEKNTGQQVMVFQYETFDTI